MDVKLLELPPARVAYLRHIGPYGATVGKFWADTFYPWQMANNLEGHARYGVSHDDPSITPPEKCRYDACVEVPENFVATGNAVVTILPGGRYVVAKFNGTNAAIGAAWTELFRDWLPSSGLQCDSRPCFEYYSKESRFDPQTGVFDCELCIPVRPL